MAEEVPIFKIFYRRQYVPGVCHVCKSPTIGQNRGLNCSECKLVYYCGSEHMEQDAEDHDEICQAFQEIAKRVNCTHAFEKAFLSDFDTFKQFKLGMVQLCTEMLSRPLFLWETEVCLFPPLCSMCHKYDDLMNACSSCCQTFWCSPNHRPVDHDQHCSSLTLFKDIIAKKIGSIKAPEIMKRPKRMNDLEALYSNKIESSLLSEIATSPLTILESMPLRHSLVIHIIGAEPQFEANNICKWETFLFNLVPDVKSLKMVFIGPEVGVCFSKNVTRNERLVSYNFYKALYHKFETLNQYENPDMICLFNPGLYRKTGYLGQDTWKKTIETMFRRSNTPVLITAYTMKEINLDIDRVHEIVGTSNVCTVVPPTANPFSSGRPIMNFVSDYETPIAFKNAFRTVLTRV